jgi:hypothetical protein
MHRLALIGATFFGRRGVCGHSTFSPLNSTKDCPCHWTKRMQWLEGL